MKTVQGGRETAANAESVEGALSTVPEDRAVEGTTSVTIRTPNSPPQEGDGAHGRNPETGPGRGHYVRTPAPVAGVQGIAIDTFFPHIPDDSDDALNEGGEGGSAASSQVPGDRLFVYFFHATSLFVIAAAIAFGSVTSRLRTASVLFDLQLDDFVQIFTWASILVVAVMAFGMIVVHLRSKAGSVMYILCIIGLLLAEVHYTKVVGDAMEDHLQVVTTQWGSLPSSLRGHIQRLGRCCGLLDAADAPGDVAEGDTFCMALPEGADGPAVVGCMYALGEVSFSIRQQMTGIFFFTLTFGASLAFLILRIIIFPNNKR